MNVGSSILEGYRNWWTQTFLIGRQKGAGEKVSEDLQPLDRLLKIRANR